MSRTKRIFTTLAIAILGAAMTSPRGSPGSGPVPAPEPAVTSAGADMSAVHAISTTPFGTGAASASSTTSTPMSAGQPAAVRPAATGRQDRGAGTTGAGRPGPLTRTTTGAVRVPPRR